MATNSKNAAENWPNWSLKRTAGRFLFGRDVCNVLDELRRRGLEITVANSMRRETPPEEEMRYVYTMREHQQWFTCAEPHVSKAFEKYLKLGWLR